MLSIKKFTFNPFQENTYILYDETKECVIIDPGCYDANEKKMLSSFIEENALKPIFLLNTHCHIDHVLGNRYVFEQYQLKPRIHAKEAMLLDAAQGYGKMYGILMEGSPEPIIDLEEHDEIKFGITTLKILFTPGHSPGSVCFYSADDATIIAGDVLFKQSIGRTDLPGGSMEQLMDSIHTRLLVLDDNTEVHPGHGEKTTIGYERNNNPFILSY
jgi:glyoxylase-like metal-dependent hydrolase (beta-lactamase superfamily II)